MSGKRQLHIALSLRCSSQATESEVVGPSQFTLLSGWRASLLTPLLVPRRNAVLFYTFDIDFGDNDHKASSVLDSFASYTGIVALKR
jgi:hypothetical protein